MLTQQILVTFLFLLGIICLTLTFVRFYSNNLKKYKFDHKKVIESQKDTCDSCYAQPMN